MVQARALRARWVIDLLKEKNKPWVREANLHLQNQFGHTLPMALRDDRLPALTKVNSIKSRTLRAIMEAWHIVNWRAPALRQGDWVQAIEVDHDLGFIYQVRENPESTRVDELMKLDYLINNNPNGRRLRHDNIEIQGGLVKIETEQVGRRIHPIKVVTKNSVVFHHKKPNGVIKEHRYDTAVPDHRTNKALYWAIFDGIEASLIKPRTRDPTKVALKCHLAKIDRVDFIRNSIAPPRAKQLEWLVMLDKVFTQKRRNTFYRLQEENQEHCPHCGREESLTHLMATCRTVRPIYTFMADEIPGFHELLLNRTAREIAFMDFQVDETQFEFLTSFRYSIWLARNRVLFQGKPTGTHHVCQFITNYMMKRSLEVSTAISKGWAPKRIAENPDFWKEMTVAFRDAKKQARQRIREANEEPEDLEEEEIDRYFENIEQQHARENQKRNERRTRAAAEKAAAIEEMEREEGENDRGYGTDDDIGPDQRAE
jgi:hypothetical protein